MFDIGFFEFLLVLGWGLVVLGPSRLPQAVRTFGLWRRQLRNWLQSTRWELEQEMGLDDLERLRRDGYLDPGEEAGETGEGAAAGSDTAENQAGAKEARG